MVWKWKAPASYLWIASIEIYPTHDVCCSFLGLLQLKSHHTNPNNSRKLSLVTIPISDACLKSLNPAYNKVPITNNKFCTLVHNKPNKNFDSSHCLGFVEVCRLLVSLQDIAFMSLLGWILDKLIFEEWFETFEAIISIYDA